MINILKIIFSEQKLLRENLLRLILSDHSFSFDLREYIIYISHTFLVIAVQIHIWLHNQSLSISDAILDLFLWLLLQVNIF
jgi:hypothetical protein